MIVNHFHQLNRFKKMHAFGEQMVVTFHYNVNNICSFETVVNLKIKPFNGKHAGGGRYKSETDLDII